MKTRPITFSDDMIRAILAGRKTQTRRIVKTRSVLDSLNEVGSWDGPGEVEDWERSMCPYGTVGDRLWVREVWAPGDSAFQCHECEPPHYVWYRADDSLRNDEGRNVAEGNMVRPRRWRSPLFMSREISRLTLEITEVRAQRLRDISEGDARAEGFESRAGFEAYWNTLYEKEPEKQWAANPWVWAISFRRVEK